MGVYIKGMKMPESCFYCRFRNKVNPDEIMCLATGEIFEETFMGTIKMRNGAGKCPLVEIPEPYGEHLCEDEVVSCLEGADWINEVIRIFLDLQAEGSEGE